MKNDWLYPGTRLQQYLGARGKETKRKSENYIEEDSGEKKERNRLELLGQGASSIS